MPLRSRQVHKGYVSGPAAHMCGCAGCLDHGRIMNTSAAYRLAGCDTTLQHVMHAHLCIPSLPFVPSQPLPKLHSASLALHAPHRTAGARPGQGLRGGGLCLAYMHTPTPLSLSALLLLLRFVHLMACHSSARRGFHVLGLHAANCLPRWRAFPHPNAAVLLTPSLLKNRELFFAKLARIFALGNARGLNGAAWMMRWMALAARAAAFRWPPGPRCC